MIAYAGFTDDEEPPRGAQQLSLILSWTQVLPLWVFIACSILAVIEIEPWITYGRFLRVYNLEMAQWEKEKKEAAEAEKAKEEEKRAEEAELAVI